MANSMTSFARSDSSTDWGDITWEIRSVNHRYLDISARLPENLRHVEPKLREIISKRLARGRVDCTLRFNQQDSVLGSDVQLNEEAIRRLAALSQRVNELAPGLSSLGVSDVLKWPGVVSGAEIDADKLDTELFALLSNALDALVEVRRTEGSRLAEMILQRLDGLTEKIAEVREILPELEQTFRQRLQAYVSEISDKVDPSRLEQEVILFLQKTDVEEEMDRLNVHVAEVGKVLKKSVPVGRRLDFLMQELNRETNTLGSKSSDVRLNAVSVDMKVLIEQMREQVQNIE